MDTRDTPAAVSSEYAALADAARVEAEQLHARWAAAGEEAMAAHARRLAGLLAKARDAALRGELPPRSGGFPLTRFAGEIEWGPEGAELVDKLYAAARAVGAGVSEPLTFRPENALEDALLAARENGDLEHLLVTLALADVFIPSAESRARTRRRG